MEWLDGVLDWLYAVDWEALYELVLEEAKGLGPKVILFLLSMLMLIWAWVRHRQAWRARSFFDEVNCSIFSLPAARPGRPQKIKVRTFNEQQARDLWPNDFGCAMIRKKARKASTETPLVVLGDDAEQVLEFVRDSLSALFPRQWLEDAVEADVAKTRFLFAIAAKPLGPTSLVKLRIIAVPKNQIPRMAKLLDAHGEVDLETSHNGFRLRVLRHFLALYNSEDRKHAIGEVELPVGRVRPRVR